MKILKHLLILLLSIIFALILYVGISFLLTYIPVKGENYEYQSLTETIYLNDNGVHVDIIIPNENYDTFTSYGWGSKIFYIETKEWSDLTFTNAFKALFTQPEGTMHVTNYRRINPKWTKVHIHKNQLDKLREFVNNSFTLKDGEKIIIPGATYGYGDKFYESTHNYSCVKTCNTWVNQALKYAGLPSCVWTPYNFGIMRNYTNFK